MLVKIINGNYDWDLSYDVHGFWDRFLDGMAVVPRDTTPRDLVRRVFTESRNADVDYTKLLINRIDLYA